MNVIEWENTDSRVHANEFAGKVLPDRWVVEEIRQIEKETG
jgi:hypothetical protein